MSDFKDLVKKHKKLEAQIKKITKLRLNDRATSSWVNLRALKKEKLKLKDKISQQKKWEIVKGRSVARCPKRFELVYL